LQWNEQRFVLQDPHGQLVVDVEIALAHRAIDLSEAFIDGTIGFVSPGSTLRFKLNRAALAELRELVDAGLRSDPEYRATLRRQSLFAMPFGAVAFLVAGGLFGCYCWYASWAPDPPADSWIHSFGWLIKGVLLVLFAVALVGLGFGGYGLRQWWRIRSIERTLPD
jgi:hypothetical protein